MIDIIYFIIGYYIGFNLMSLFTYNSKSRQNPELIFGKRVDIERARDTYNKLTKGQL